MRTRSQTRNRNRQQQAQPAVVQPFHLEEPFVNPPLVPMADNRTMAQLLQAPTEGYEDAIVIPEINANFELKHATDAIVYRDNIKEYVFTAAARHFNQGNTNSRPPMVSNQIRPPGFPPIQNNQNRFNQTQGNNFNQNQGTNFNQNRGSNFNQGQVYQPPTIQTPVYQAPSPAPQMQGVSKTDFENYVKANDAVLRNMQNQGQGLQNQKTNLTEMLSKFISSNTASSSNSGTLPSQTVTNPREQVNAITTRRGKTCEGPSTPHFPTPIVSTPLKEPEQNPGKKKTSIAKKTVKRKPNSPEPDSYQPKLPIPRGRKVREKDKPIAQQSMFMKLFKQLRLEIGLKDALHPKCAKFNKWFKHFIRENKEKHEEIGQLQPTDRISLAIPKLSINLLPHSIYKQLGLGALKPTRMTLELANRSVTHPMGYTRDLYNENHLFNEMVEDIENENSNVSNSDEPVLLNTPLSDKVECSDPEVYIDEIDAFLAMEVSSIL
ncbi:hypothetical protein Tco_1165233 [Tanacetum coccineum]